MVEDDTYCLQQKFSPQERQLHVHACDERLIILRGAGTKKFMGVRTTA